jgi:ABC-type amino acid transport substrate-binding protein
MKKLAISFFSIAAIGIFYFTISAKSDDEPNNILTVGMMSGWAPFMSVNPQGGFEGFDVDVANGMCARLKKTCKIVDMGSLAPLFVALESNKIDAIFSGLDITKARREKMTMVPYFGEKLREYYLLFWQQIPESVKTIDDLKNMQNPVVVVEPGVGPEKYLDQFKFIEKKQIAILSDRLLDLQYGKSLAVFLEPEMSLQLMRKNPAIKGLPVPLPEDLQIDGMGIALKKENSEQSAAIRAAIEAMKADGTINKLAARWFNDEGSNAK